MSGIQTLVKPPNDVLALQGEKARKLCGILIEASGNSQNLSWVIIGVGINVNRVPPHLSATSLKALTGHTWNVTEVLKAFLDEFNWRFRVFGPAPNPSETVKN
jgi:biotin-(acetyl-CoA carboxylase) ligase